MDKDSVNYYWIDQVTESVDTISKILAQSLKNCSSVYGNSFKEILTKIEQEIRVINIYLTAIGMNEQSDDKTE